jgi:hypothetical protein
MNRRKRRQEIGKRSDVEEVQRELKRRRRRVSEEGVRRGRDREERMEEETGRDRGTTRWRRLGQEEGGECLRVGVRSRRQRERVRGREKG